MVEKIDCCVRNYLTTTVGKLLGTLATPTTASGYLKLLAWARSLGCVWRAGVEGTGIL